ncbi:hypothetical protein CPB83DRAFT_187249 [Crepidotus variabilis]|uniref:F-box domain-containing protein n=1 Tax=Crepidotus variabilis TaxID=179855 RepID=A0A9P6EJV7_9AGAR|nr:hypothetical protein CPB83DRAFT_187249 [Crepidotus variabilis]
MINAIFDRHNNVSDTLTDAEVTTVSQYLDDCSVTLDGFGTEIQNLRSQIESLCSQYTILAYRTVEKVNEMDVVRLLFAPVRRLPPEVLTMIFRLALPSHAYRPRVQVNAVLRLSLVCKVWRDVVRGDSSLWQHHCVTIPDSQVALASSLLDRTSSLAALQERAGMRPMSLTIRDIASNFNETPQMTAIMDFLITSFAKYSHLDFQPLSLLWQNYFEGRGVALSPILLSNVVSMHISMHYRL